MATRARAPRRTTKLPRAAGSPKAAAAASGAAASRAATPKGGASKAGAPKAGASKAHLVAWPAAVFDTRRGKLRPADAYEVGRLVVEELYAGERPEHGRRGRTTFRKIAADLDGRMSAQALYRCAAIYEMCRDLKLEPNWEHVGLSHLSLVLGLSSAQQRRLVQQTERSRWSVERLRTEAARLRAGRRARKGRRPLPRFVRAARQLERFTDGRDELLADLESMDTLDRSVLEPMLAQVVELRGQLDALSRSLKSALRRR